MGGKWFLFQEICETEAKAKKMFECKSRKFMREKQEK